MNLCISFWGFIWKKKQNKNEIPNWSVTIFVLGTLIFLASKRVEHFSLALAQFQKFDFLVKTWLYF